MKTLEKKFKKVRSNVVQSINSKEINLYLKIISENLSNLIIKDKETILKENNNGKYENAYDLITNQENNNHILFLALITFHHKEGAVVECTFPSKKDIISSEKLSSLIDESNEKINSKNLVFEYILNNLVNYCLIDGIHLTETDSNFFFIHDFSKILYCFSYFVQIKTDEKDNFIQDDFQENIRGCIQKSICIVSTLPLFGNLITYENYFTHLSIQMALYMSQKCLNDKSALNEIYNKLNNDYCKDKKWIFNLRKAFSLLKDDLLIILKLIILEKRIVIFSKIPSNASLLIMTLLSFFPGIFGNGKLLFNKQIGVPFKIFHEKYLIYPLFTLFDLDKLLEKVNNDPYINFLIGTTNNLILTNKKLNYSCMINIDEQKIIYNENLNESLKILNGREHKLLLNIYELLNQKICDSNIISNKTEKRNSSFTISNEKLNTKKEKNDEPWILNYENGNKQLFHLIKKDINLYYQRILYDTSYLIYEMEKKRKKDSYTKLIDYHKNLIQNYIKSTSNEITEINGKTDSNNNNTIPDKIGEYNLPHLEELLADPFSYVLCTILPINYDYIYPTSDKNKTNIEKKRESILTKLNNLAFLSEWTNKRTFNKWFCSYKEQIIYNSTLNPKKAMVKIYDYDENLYKGGMLLGKKNGAGELDYIEEKMVYSGEFKNDLREGHGKLTSKDGSYFYVGDWKNNKMDGDGILYSSKLGKYKGQFHKDYFEGKGHFVDLENNEYDGMFHKSLKKGKGELKLSDGKVYIGEFKNGKYNGKGTLKDSKGNILQEGEFKDGVLIKSKKLSNYKDDKNTKDNISIISKDSSKCVKVNPLNENEEMKLSSIHQNDSIDEDENEENNIKDKKEIEENLKKEELNENNIDEEEE